jgi:hydrogenase nickel incorporation protein HypA/HybF
VDDSVQFYWDFVAENTICEGAKLNFSRIPAKLECQHCNNEYAITERLTSCPVCGGYHTRIVSGEEFFIESIEIEKEEMEPS